MSLLQKKLKKNIGEVPQYYVHNSHPVIINPEDWDAVQFEFSKCTKQSNYHKTTNKFLEKIKCTLYGVVYGSNVCIFDKGKSGAKHQIDIHLTSTNFPGYHLICECKNYNGSV